MSFSASFASSSICMGMNLVSPCTKNKNITYQRMVEVAQTSQMDIEEHFMAFCKHVTTVSHHYRFQMNFNNFLIRCLL